MIEKSIKLNLFIHCHWIISTNFSTPSQVVVPSCFMFFYLLLSFSFFFNFYSLYEWCGIVVVVVVVDITIFFFSHLQLLNRFELLFKKIGFGLMILFFDKNCISMRKINSIELMRLALIHCIKFARFSHKCQS